MVAKALNKVPAAACGDYEEIPVESGKPGMKACLQTRMDAKHILTENKTQINNLIKRFS
jgi:hypothetical protein